MEVIHKVFTIDVKLNRVSGQWEGILTHLPTGTVIRHASYLSDCVRHVCWMDMAAKLSELLAETKTPQSPPSTFP